MNKIIVFNMISVDGYFADPKGKIDWHNVDAEFNEFAIEQLGRASLLLFGRKTYELMAGYWPGKLAKKSDPIVAGLMNNAAKIVFSTTLERAKWNNTKLFRRIDPKEIKKLKEQSDKELFIFGSGMIVKEFARLGLVDEYRLMVNPVILGSGKPLFKDRLNLNLLKTRVFGNGNVLLYYEPK